MWNPVKELLFSAMVIYHGRQVIYLPLIPRVWMVMLSNIYSLLTGF